MTFPAFRILSVNRTIPHHMLGITVLRHAGSVHPSPPKLDTWAKLAHEHKESGRVEGYGPNGSIRRVEKERFEQAKCGVCVISSRILKAASAEINLR